MPGDALRALDAHRARLVPLLGSDAEQAWLVGGVVRDALLARPLLDVDITIGGDPKQAARAIARELGGTAFELGDGDEHGVACWRVTIGASDSDEHQQVDVCSLRGGSLSEDLAARDFTANALAVPLLGPLEPIDEHGGLGDIAAERLRMISPTALDDDPLRMLRAARIAHQLGWMIDEATVGAVRERAARIAEPAGERIFHELRLLLLHPESRRGWRLLERLGLAAELLPELESCRGMVQSRFHHLDVHDHTLAVLDNCEDLLSATEFWLPLPSEAGLVAAPWSDQQRLVVLLAALCHDLGKPGTRTEREDGRIGFAGHDATGATIVDAIAERWRWSGAMRRQVRALVNTHLALGFLLHTDRGPAERWKLRRQFGEIAPEAVVLSVADRLATSGVDDRRRWVRAHLSLARDVWADHWRTQRDGVPVPLLDGGEIARLLGITPGPRVGELVERLALAQALGEIVTVDDARQLLARQ
jgi:tRNA nucleotidyltransferase/poly(A) polymerase